MSKCWVYVPNKVAEECLAPHGLTADVRSTAYALPEEAEFVSKDTGNSFAKVAEENESKTRRNPRSSPNLDVYAGSDNGTPFSD